jgi:hypothetical protein
MGWCPISHCSKVSTSLNLTAIPTIAKLVETVLSVADTVGYHKLGYDIRILLVRRVRGRVERTDCAVRRRLQSKTSFKIASVRHAF